DPDGIAIVAGEARWTFGALVRAAERLAAALVEQGVQPGDRVAIYAEKSPEVVVAILATSMAGGAFVNVNPLLKARQAEHIMRDCRVRLAVAEADKLAALGAAAPERAIVIGDLPPGVEGGRAWLRWDDVLARDPAGVALPRVQERDMATIIYTSGSTGLPKGVVFSQRNVVAGAEIVATYLENTPEDRILSVLPFSFDYGLNQLTTALLVGATLVLQRSAFPGDLLRALREHEITGLAGVPPLWALLLQASKDLEEQPLPALRYITNSGGQIPAAHLAELRRLLPTTQIYLMYGLTEAFRSTYLPPSELHRGPTCIGRPIPNTDIWVVDEEGRMCGPGEVGELVHRGPTVSLGYWGKPEATAEVFRPNPFAPPELPHPEWVVYSGDLVCRDEDGYLHFVGRKDHLIKTQGYRVSPEEVEDLLVGTGLVREACAFGLPDPDLGQQIVAVVVPRGDPAPTVEEIRRACLRAAPPYLVPKQIRIAPELPRTPSGKIDRQAVRDANAG
ncbi:MAG: acyl-CoA ligase (AMP-forming), exosortase A system-associated, partial [Sphaerobacter sp.]|nr:acyl-CoA ligase (AMP-forming), exosortase A system-associated [Sphaerobacter sp.]